MYDQYGESNLNYHELLTEFLQHLCERTRKGPPTSTAVRPRPRRHAPDDSSRRRRRERPAGAQQPAAPAPPRRERPNASWQAPRRRTATPTPIAGDQIYCTTAQKFTRRPAHPAGRLAAHQQAARAARARACRCRCRRSPPSRPRPCARAVAHRVEQQRDRRTRQAEAPVGDARRRRHLRRHAHRDRPRRQLLHGHTARSSSDTALSARTAPRAPRLAQSSSRSQTTGADRRLSDDPADERLAGAGPRAAPRGDRRAGAVRDDVPAVVQPAEPSTARTRRSARTASARSATSRSSRRPSCWSRPACCDAVRARRGPRRSTCPAATARS